MKYIFFLFPIFLQAQCLIPTHSYRLICADEVRYADSIASGSRLYISSRNAFVTSPRSVFSLVNGYGQHFIQITNSANSQKVAINRAWINRIDSTSSNKALIYIKDISVTFTTTESYTAVKDSAIACFIRSVASGLATLSDGDYGDVVVSGGGLVMTVDKPDLGLHNLADGDFSVVADSTALSLTNTRQITLQTKNIDGWISRYLQTHNSLTLRTNNTTKTSRIYVDTTGANFQFVNGSNNASLRIGDSVAVRFNTSGSVGQVLTVTSVDGDGRLVINPKTGGSGTANCEQTLTKTSHGFRKWTPIYWNGSAWARPTYDSIIPTYIVVDSTSANTFKVSNCGNYSSTLTAGIYYYTGTSPGYTLTQPEIKVPLFEVAQARLILQPLVGFQLASGSGGVSSMVLADTAAAIRADFPSTKRDTFITVPPNTTYFPNIIDNPARFYNNIYLSCKGRTDTSIVAFLGVPVFDEQKGVVYNIKNDSGLVAAFVITNEHFSNSKRLYLLKRGQTAQVRLLPDAANAGQYGWAVNVVWDTFTSKNIYNADGVIPRGERYVYLGEDGGDSYLYYSESENRADAGSYLYKNNAYSDLYNYIADPATGSYSRVAGVLGSANLGGNSFDSRIFQGYFTPYNSLLGYGGFKGSLEKDSLISDISAYTDSVSRGVGTVSSVLGNTPHAGYYKHYVGISNGDISNAISALNPSPYYGNQRSFINNSLVNYHIQTANKINNNPYNWISVKDLDNFTANRAAIALYNDSYTFPNFIPVATNGAKSAMLWTGTGTGNTGGFQRYENTVTTGITDGSGDLTVTFIAAMPDNSYTIFTQNEGSIAYILSTQPASKTTGSVKVRVFDATGAAVTATSVTISYEVKDY